MNNQAAQPAKTHQVKEFKYNAPFIGCRIDPTGRFLVGSAQDFTLQRWEIATDKQAALKGHGSWVRGMAFLPDGSTLISGGFDGRLIWWPADAEKPEPIRTIDDAHNGWVRAVAVSPDGAQVATCGNDNLVKLWTAQGELVREMPGHERHVYNVAFHPSGEALVSVDLMGKVKQFAVADGAEMRELDGSKLHKYDNTFRADIGGARSLAFSPDGKLLALGGITDVSNAFAGVGNAAAVLLDWETGEQKLLLVGKSKVQGVLWGLAFHPEGFVVGTVGGRGGQLLFWRPDAEKDADKAFHQMKLPSDGRDLSLHPDGQQLAVCHYDSRVRLYKMAEKPPAKDAKK